MTTVKSKNLGQALKERRWTIQMTLQMLSNASGVSPSHIARIEQGERYPSAWILRKLARPLGITETELLRFAGYLSQDPPVAEESQTGVWRLDPYVVAPAGFVKGDELKGV